jgi:epoxide hydrolase-like predicted phosphatase
VGDIRAVLFDWGGVFTNLPMRRLFEMETALGYRRRQMVDWIFHTGLPTDSSGEQPEEDFALLEKGRISIEEFHARVLARSAEHLGEPMDRLTYDSITEHFDTNPGIHTVHWVMVQRARQLRSEGYRIGILTNQILGWREFWRTSIPLEEFDVIVDSCVVGMRKPEPAIMQLACDELGVRPKQAAFLDDSLRNIAGARAFGLAAIHVLDPVQAIAELDALLYSSSSSDSRSIA